MSKISSMLKSKLEAWIEYPGLDGFEVLIVHLSRDELAKIRDANSRPSFDPRTREKTEKIDEEMFVKHYVTESVKDWRGLTWDSLSKILPIPELPEGVKWEDEVEFDIDNAITLVKESPSFDSWVSEVQRDLSNFRKRN